jgi:NAD(P)H-dependent flavin oxidoreductase YrpB (nitropropane dioxygenase family)
LQVDLAGAAAHNRSVGRSLQTPICADLGIEYPIFSVGFGFSAGPDLVCAVSDAGGCGVLGASGMPDEHIRAQISAVRERTDRTFGVNLIIAELTAGESAEDMAFVRAQAAAIIEERAPILVLFWGDPAPFVADAHRNGVRVFVQVGSVGTAEDAAAAGVDAVIAQGIEAGGHVIGTTSIWDLLPATVAAVAPTPVLASGGIGDGAGVARALRLGAQGVSLGTRFVASDEAWIHPTYKQSVVDSTAADTYYGELFDVGWPDAPHRVLRNKAVQEWEMSGCAPSGARPGEGTSIGVSRRPWGDFEWPRYSPGMVMPDFDGDPEYAPMWAGESCEVVDDIKPAGVIVRDLARQAEAALADAAPA